MAAYIRMNLPTSGTTNVGSEQVSGSDLVTLIESIMKEFHGKTDHKLQILARQVEEVNHKVVSDRKDFLLNFQNTDHKLQLVASQVREVNHKVVDKVQSALEKTTGGSWIYTNQVPAPNERRLRLMFFDEVSIEVLTGKEIKGKRDNPVRLGIVDETEQVVKSGPGSSAKVEILLLEVNADDNGNSQSDQDFKSGEVKPHFAKPHYVLLENGIGDLRNAKLAHDSKWTRSCKRQLGARVVENLSGIKVQEACTEAFMVSDKRSKLYAKHYPPSLSDEVWRLVNIARGGKPWQRLKENNILTVQDLLFLNSVYPHRLHEIIHIGENPLKAIKDHAQSCIIDDTRICLYNSSEDNISVVFDVVGNLKGIIHDSQYILKSCLSKDLKGLAHKLLCSAYGDRESITYHNDEETLTQQFPYQATNASRSIQESVHGCNPTIPAYTDHIDPTKPSTSFQSICRSGQPSGIINNTSSYHDPDQTSYAATHVSIQDNNPAGCNSTIDVSGQAEIPENFHATYQPCEEVNSTDENGLRWEDFNQPSDAAMEEYMIQSFLENLDPSLPIVDGTEVQFYNPKLEPHGPMSMPNSNQDQRARTGSGGGEPVLNSTGNSSRRVREFARDSLNWNKPMKRSQMQRMARKASGPGQQQGEARMRSQQQMSRNTSSPGQQHGEAQSRLRSRSRSRGPQIRTADLGREGRNCRHGRGCRHGFGGHGGSRVPVLSCIACRERRIKN